MGRLITTTTRVSVRVAGVVAIVLVTGIVGDIAIAVGVARVTSAARVGSGVSDALGVNNGASSARIVSGISGAIGSDSGASGASGSRVVSGRVVLDSSLGGLIDDSLLVLSAGVVGVVGLQQTRHVELLAVPARDVAKTKLLQHGDVSWHLVLVQATCKPRGLV
jgi:hypothetical protein